MRGNVKEAEIDLEEESDDEEENQKDPVLPSSSCTTMTNSKEDGDSDGERSVDSGERTGVQGDADEEVEEVSEGVKLPVLKSYDPRFVSPQEAPKTKKASQKSVTPPAEALMLLGEEKEVIEEDLRNSIPTPQPSFFRASNALGLEGIVEETGSDCLPGRCNLEKSSGKKKDKKSTKSTLHEKEVVEDKGQESDYLYAPEQDLVQGKAKGRVKETQVEVGEGVQTEKVPERKKGREKSKVKSAGNGDRDEDKEELQQSKGKEETERVQSLGRSGLVRRSTMRRKQSQRLRREVKWPKQRLRNQASQGLKRGHSSKQKRQIPRDR